MAKEIIFTVQDSPEGGFEARALSAPIVTEGDTVGWMQVPHRAINSVGFGVAGTLGWWLDGERST